MSYHIAVMPYLNNRAFFYHTALDNCELVPLTPRESVKALKQGRVQAGVVPVAGLEQLGNQFELLGHFGIASDGPVKSVLFLSQLPFESFTSANTIRLSSESVTSNNMLKLLFGYQQGFDNLPELTNNDYIYDGELLIGDRALAGFAARKDLHVSDLAEKWTQQHHLPFVFARWVINREAPLILRYQLQEWLTRFVENEACLRRITAEHEAHLVTMTAENIENYLQGIITRIGKRERAAQDLYLSELLKYKMHFQQAEQAACTPSG